MEKNSLTFVLLEIMTRLKEETLIKIDIFLQNYT